MRSVMLSLILGLGTMGLSLAAPTAAKADDSRGAAVTSDTVPVAYHWRGGYWGNRGFYRGYGGYGLYGGYGYYPYGGYGGFYSPRYYGGYYPRGYGYGFGPYSGFYW